MEKEEREQTSPKTFMLNEVEDIMICEHLQEPEQAWHILIGIEGKTNIMKLAVLSCKECALMTHTIAAANMPRDAIMEEYEGDEFFIGT